MTTPTTFRQDIGNGIEAMLNAFKAANPSLLLAVYRAQPPGYPDLPCAYIGDMPEQVSHDSGIRTRIMTPSVVVVDRITDNFETMDRQDILVDKLMDAFTAVPQFGVGTIWDKCTITEETLDYGDYILAVVRFTFQNVSIMEGRV